MARKEIYVTGNEIKKGDFLDYGEVLKKRTLKTNITKLNVQNTLTGEIRDIEISSMKYFYIVRYT